MNALRHGLLARETVLSNESREDFDRLVERFSQRFRPRNESQARLVADMCSAHWRLRRLRSTETGMMIQRINQQTTGDALDRTAAAFWDLAVDGTCDLLLRYEGHLQRTYYRSLNALIDM